MALHGEIKVNDLVIGGWEAQRTTPRLDKDKRDGENYTYRCKVWRRMEDGKEWREEFEVRHWYEDGALELASKVLRQAAMRGVV